MKLDNAQTILNRINRMFADVAEGGGSASTLERDLLKEYVRRLYESLTEEAPVTAEKAVEPVVETPVKAKPVPPVAEIRRPKPAPKPAPAPEPVAQKVEAEVAPPAPTPPSKPKTIQIPASVEADIKEMEAQASFQPAPMKVDNTATVMTAPPIFERAYEKPTARPSTASLPSAIKAIFEGEKSNDLSAKLSGAPVKDLNRAMAINERLLAQNDLFGGNKAELDAALMHLNTLDTFDEAVAYLGSGVADKYDWAEGERKATARAFAKLVSRRYS
ncbi:MAG: hypothetical protein AB8F78_06945 [Saprospiraceae bacterium]